MPYSIEVVDVDIKKEENKKENEVAWNHIL